VLIGCWMGITPGGATPASFMSYGMAKRISKNGAKFGEGEIEGVIAPIIVVICAIGAFTVHNNIFDVYMMVVFGVVGYLFKKLKYPLAPLVLALVLGDMAESAFRQSMLLSNGSLRIFYSNPLVGSIVTLAIVILAWPLLSRLLASLRAKPPAAGVRTDDAPA
jgi:TctA family transporter